MNSKIIIDLMPLSDKAKNGEIILEGSGMTKIRLDGFEEAYKKGSINTQLESEIYRACSIPGIVILKLIAYDDRPDRRIKDIIDITRICKYYPDLETDLIWENHNELYVDDLSHDEVGMIVLGREMNNIISENDELKSRIIQILDKAINRKSAILELMITNNLTETLDEKAIILTRIKQGLIEN